MHLLPYWRLSSYYFFYFAFIGVFFPYFGLYFQSLSLSAWDIGLLMSLMQFMRLFGPYLWGMIADRLGQRVPVIRFTGLAALIVFTQFFFLTRFEWLFLVMVLLAVFWVASLPLVEALTFDHLHEHAARYSRIRLWGSIGFIVAVMGAGALLDHLPVFSLVWMTFALLAGILMCSLLLPEAPTHHHLDEPAPVGEVMRQPQVKALFAGCFLMSAAHAALNIFYSIFLTEHSYAKTLVGALFSLGVVAEIVVFVYMAPLMRRFSLRTILLASFAVGIVRFVLIGCGADSLFAQVLAQLMHGITFGAFHATAIAAVNRWFPGRLRARGQAIYSSLSFGAGGLFGGLLSGRVWDSLGGEAAMLLGTAYSLVGFLVVARWIPGGSMREQ